MTRADSEVVAASEEVGAAELVSAAEVVGVAAALVVPALSLLLPQAAARARTAAVPAPKNIRPQ